MRDLSDQFVKGIIRLSTLGPIDPVAEHDELFVHSKAKEDDEVMNQLDPWQWCDLCDCWKFPT